MRIKDSLLNGTALKSGSTVDLLVCDGSRVLVGLACSLETAKLFNRDMHGLFLCGTIQAL